MINFLPPEEKKGLLVEETKRLTMVLGLVILISLFCLIMILAFLKIYLLILVDFQESVLELTKTKAESSEFQIVKGKIENSNQKLSRINDFYERAFNSVELLEKLTQTIPEGIYLTDFSYAKASSQIILAGFSPSRDLLIQLKNNLEGKFGEKKVSFPPSGWNEPVDINFAGVKINFSNENLE